MTRWLPAELGSSTKKGHSHISPVSHSPQGCVLPSTSAPSNLQPAVALHGLKLLPVPPEHAQSLGLTPQYLDALSAQRRKYAMYTLGEHFGQLSLRTQNCKHTYGSLD